jgi:hypothetical protein
MTSYSSISGSKRTSRKRTYQRGGFGLLNAPRVDVRPKATPITPSWLCGCGTYNAPQRAACTACAAPQPEPPDAA